MAIADPAPGQGDVPVNAVAQGAAPQAEEAGGEQVAGGATALVKGINDDMIELMDLMQNAGAPEQAMQEMAGVLRAYQEVVTRALAGGGEQPQRVAEQGGNVPVEAGAASVQPAV